MTAAIPDAVKQIGSEAGIALRFALADIAPHEAAALWSRSGVISLMNEAFARAILAERERCAQIAESQIARDDISEGFKAFCILTAIRNPTGE